MVCEQNLCKSDLLAAVDTLASCSTFCFHGNSCILEIEINDEYPSCAMITKKMKAINKKVSSI